jgi:hypothetical protein
MDGELKASPEIREPKEMKTPEQAPEVKAEPAVERKPAELPKSTPLERPAVVAPAALDQESQAIDRAMEDGLLEPYLAMSKEQREKFRAEGVALVSYFRGFVGRPKALPPHRAQKAIKQWLRAVNVKDPFWLTQALAIKTRSVLEELRGDEETMN